MLMMKTLKYMFLMLFIFISACAGTEATGQEFVTVRVVDDEFSPKVINVPVG